MFLVLQIISWQTVCKITYAFLHSIVAISYPFFVSCLLFLLTFGGFYHDFYLFILFFLVLFHLYFPHYTCVWNPLCCILLYNRCVSCFVSSVLHWSDNWLIGSDYIIFIFFAISAKSFVLLPTFKVLPIIDLLV